MKLADILLVSGAVLLVVALAMVVTAVVARRVNRVSVVDITWGLALVAVALVCAVVGPLVADGDPIALDVASRRIDLEVDDAELERRRAAWKRPAPHYTSGVLAKYARLASGAERGAITEA